MNEINKIIATTDKEEKITSWATINPVSVEFEITDEKTIKQISELLKEARQRELERVCHNYYYKYVKRW